MLFDELIISTDIEADGPIPGPYSMLSLGSAAFAIEEKSKGVWEPRMISQFSVNLETIPGATADPDTMDWRKKHPEAWEKNRENLKDPIVGMCEYRDWLEAFDQDVVFAAWPATYDFTFVYWYLINFAQRSPFGYSGLDARSYALSMTQLYSWKQPSKKSMTLEEWIPNNPMPHVAINDAIQQGHTICHILIENLT